MHIFEYRSEALPSLRKHTVNNQIKEELKRVPYSIKARLGELGDKAGSVLEYCF